jgi:aminopeptidase N
MFKKCLHAYMDRWNGKHPIPWDFYHTYNDVSGKDLNWFWTNWFFSNNYIDMAVKDVVKSKSGYTVTIDNIGGMAAPVNFAITYADGTNESIHQTPGIWQANQKQAKVTLSSKKEIKSLKLDGNIWMDADASNNEWSKPVK